jgi:nitrogen-specific signal transduction histidine kinase
MIARTLTQVANAVNYTSSGSVTLSASRVQRDASADPADVQVLFEVTDTGAGISKSEQSKLWLPYVRGGTAIILLYLTALLFSFSAFALLVRKHVSSTQEMRRLQRAPASVSSSLSDSWRRWIASLC